MSDKSVAEKLFLKPGGSLLLVNAPSNAKSLIGSLPKGTKLITDLSSADVAVLFARDRKELEANLGRLKKRLNSKGALWVAYNKGSSKQKADINRDSIREYAATVGLTAVALISIDADWSCLRLKES